MRPFLRSAVPALLVLTGCGAFGGGDEAPGERLRRATYPPGFNYVPEEKLRSTMWHLGAQLQQLDDLLADEPTPDPARRREVADLLDAMLRTTNALGPGGWPSNHPEIPRNVEQLRADLERARFAVNMDPPNDFFARELSTTCLRCHGQKDLDAPAR